MKTCVVFDLPLQFRVHARRLLLGNTVQQQDGVRSYAAIQNSVKWERNRLITIHLMDGEPFFRNKVQEFAGEWMRYVGLGFETTRSPEADVKISFNEDGLFWSVYGTDALAYARGVPTMNFGWTSTELGDDHYRADVLHEFGHMLGLVHEHQSPAASVPWDREAVYRYYRDNYGWSEARTNANVLDEYSPSDITNSEFDPDSIMVYPIPNELTIGDYSVDANLTLSATDKELVARAYPR